MQAGRKNSVNTHGALSASEQLLGDFPLFADLKRNEIKRLARGAVSYELPRGRVLFHQGEACAALHLIVSGQVKLSVQTARGDEKVIELVDAGGSLGEVALLMKQPYIMTAEVIADARFVELGRDAVLGQLAHNVNFLRCILGEVCRRLNQRTRDLEDCLLLNGTQRVAGFLLSQAPANGSTGTLTTITLPAKKSIIASRLNLTHEHFSRILRDIQTAGLVEVRGRQIRLLNVARLRNFPD